MGKLSSAFASCCATSADVHVYVCPGMRVPSAYNVCSTATGGKLEDGYAVKRETARTCALAEASLEEKVGETAT